jgi:hypothetical protein
MITGHFENLQTAAEELTCSDSPAELIVKLLFPR